MRMIHRWALSALMMAALVIGTAGAMERSTPETVITTVTTYPQFGGGDVAIVVANPATNCPNGFWLSPSDPGFKSVLASILAAHHSRSRVRVYGDDAQLWSGSSGAYCRITAVASVQ